MAITVYQSAGVEGAMNDNSPDASFSTTPTTGRLVVVCATILSANQDLGTISCSDNQSNTYTAQVTAAHTNRKKQVFFTAPITTASGTFTVTVSVAGMEAWANTNIWFSITEIGGHNSSSIVDESGYNSGDSTSPSVSLAAMSADTVVFAQCLQSWAVSITEAAGWTEIYNPSELYESCYRTGDYDPSWTLGLANSWYAAGMGINAAASSTPLLRKRLNILLRLCLSMFNLIWRCFK